jgi:hypothetical protein
MSNIEHSDSANNAKRTYAYASAYAIQVIHTYHDEGDLAPFLTESGLITTTWACKALMFDTEDKAVEKMLTAEIPMECQGDEGAYLRVVRIDLTAEVEIVAVREISRAA